MRGYGGRGFPPIVPPDAVLVYEVDLLAIEIYGPPDTGATAAAAAPAAAQRLWHAPPLIKFTPHPSASLQPSPRLKG